MGAARRPAGSRAGAIETADIPAGTCGDESCSSRCAAHRMEVRPLKSSIEDESEASPLVFGPGKTFQKRNVSSPAPVTIV